MGGGIDRQRRARRSVPCPPTRTPGPHRGAVRSCATPDIIIGSWWQEIRAAKVTRAPASRDRPSRRRAARDQVRLIPAGPAALTDGLINCASSALGGRVSTPPDNRTPRPARRRRKSCSGGGMMRRWRIERAERRVAQIVAALVRPAGRLLSSHIRRSVSSRSSCSRHNLRCGARPTPPASVGKYCARGSRRD